MKQKATSKVLRAILIAAFLAVALVSGGFHKSSRVAATSCDEAFNNYLNADNTYEIARYSFFYGIPTTCQQDCTNSSNPSCVTDCQTDRHTELGNAEIGLFSMALDTCTPFTLDACAQARAMADMCITQLNSSSYSSQEELEAIFARYGACLTASKVDSCQ